ncbi:glycosyltransferase [Lysinibacillus sp. 54212]|uniref:glycosyltransferase n=1 Tax=Lysinibacillus sp. 54212 TaxID=3119829 RepID=UPI002FC716DE
MKKLAIITPTLANGGAERIISTLSQSKDLNKKYKLTIITFENDSNDYKFVCEIINLKERYPKELNSIKPLKYINYFKIIHKVKREMDFDIVISFMENMGIVNAATKKKETTIHAVSSYLSGQFEYSNSFKNNIYVFFFKMLIKKYFNKLDGILTISQESGQDLIDNFEIKKEKIIVSYNPYELKMINELSEKPGIKNKENTISIVTMGSLIDLKAQWNLLRAFKEIENKFKNVELLIIGRGENEKYLKDMTNAYHLNSKVNFIGYVTNPFKYLKNCDIYVLTSIREGLPNALIEAMACGLPVIATDCSSGPREIIAPKTDYKRKTSIIEQAENGILVPINSGIKKKISDPLDEQEVMLKEALQLLIEDEELRRKYSLRSTERSLDFDIKKIIPIWLNALGKFDGN